jgi:hypothetical protein
LELYYFNQKLSFFEPAIERVTLCLSFESGSETQRSLSKVEVRDQDVLNFNFSVALYENLFNLTENFKQEYAEYQRVLEILQQANVLVNQEYSLAQEES